MSTAFERDFNAIRRKVYEMAADVEDSVRGAVRAYESLNSDIAEEVVEGDGAVNLAQLEIDDLCAETIVRRQPVAQDLRGLIAVVRITSNLERIGDHAVHVAEEALGLERRPAGEDLRDLVAMGTVAAELVGESARAFLRRDADRARRVARRDEEIDVPYAKLAQRFIRQLAEDRKQVQRSYSILLSARSIERIGDHVCNICEAVVYACQGQHVELNC